MTGRREGPDITLIKVAIAEHRRLFDLDWNLPIAFERDGEMLIGRLHMEVSCDLMKMGREQAERDIALVIKNALLGYALEPKPLRMTLTQAHVAALTGRD